MGRRKTLAEELEELATSAPVQGALSDALLFYSIRTQTFSPLLPHQTPWHCPFAITEHDPEEDTLGGEAALEETDDELSAPPRKCVPSQPLGAGPVPRITILIVNATIS